MKSEIQWFIKYQYRSAIALLHAWRTKRNAWQRFWRSYREYKQIAPASMQPSLEYLYPCLGDDTAETPIEPTCFYQDCWAFERIVKRHPANHVDVGSHHKFVALLSKVMPVTMIDLRPLSLPLGSLKFREGSILNLPFEDGAISSLSSLCVLEHIGLGRYGDSLDPRGTEKAIAELKRVLAPGAHLWLSIPVSNENAVYFNAGRVFSVDYVLQLITPLQVLEQAFIVGSSLQNHYEYQPGFGTTALFELKVPQ